jgi:hypothetical protein
MDGTVQNLSGKSFRNADQRAGTTVDDKFGDAF